MIFDKFNIKISENDTVFHDVYKSGTVREIQNANVIVVYFNNLKRCLTLDPRQIQLVEQ